MTKILFTTPELEHPPKGGPCLRIENSIKALSNVAEVVLVSRRPIQQIGGEQALQYYRKYCSEFLFVTEQDAFLAASRLLEIAHAEGVQVLWLGYGNISYEILHHLKLQKCPYPIVIDTDSVWSRYVLRGLPYHNRLEDKIEIFSRGWLKRWEEYWGTQVAGITTAVSSVDEEYYKIFTNRANSVQVFSNVIDPENYRGVYNNPGMKKPCIYLAGTFWSGSPMEEAAKWILEKVLPIVRLSVPNIHFYIIGKNSDRVLKSRAEEGVTVTGMVESVLPYLSNADVAVVSLKFESGTRFKILEAGVCNVPIVSTTLGAEGIPVTHGHDILIADTPQEFASCIIELLNKPELSRKLATNCRGLVERQYSITAAAKEADAILRFLKHPSLSKTPFLAPGIYKISERLYRATPNSDLTTMLGFSIILFNHLMRKYGNHPLFVLDEERRDVSLLLKQIGQIMPNNSKVKEALKLVDGAKTSLTQVSQKANGIQSWNHAKVFNRKGKELHAQEERQRALRPFSKMIDKQQSIFGVWDSERANDFRYQCSIIHKKKCELPQSHCYSCDHLMGDKYFSERYCREVNDLVEEGLSLHNGQSFALQKPADTQSPENRHREANRLVEILINFKFGLKNFSDIVLRMSRQKGGAEILSYVFFLIDNNESGITVEEILKPTVYSYSYNAAVSRSIEYFKERFFTQGITDYLAKVGQRGNPENVLLPIFNKFREDVTDELKKDTEQTMRKQMKREVLNQLQISYINGFCSAGESTKTTAYNDFICKSSQQRRDNRPDYFIKQGYIIAKDSFELRATNTVDDSQKYQYSVYLKARELILRHDLKSVLDLGCGMGMKLKELIYPVCEDITGVDNEETIIKGKQLHDFGNWHACNLSGGEIKLGKKFDLIIASDVMEHLSSPDNLLGIIKNHAHHNTLIVLSTPERDLHRGVNHFGPPPGVHIREWNFLEFKDYLRSRDFCVLEHFLVPSQRNIDGNNYEIMEGEGPTQLAVLSVPICKTNGSKITFFMVVTDRDIIIADYAIASYSLIKDFKFKLIIYSNWISPENKAKYFKKWRQYDYVKIITNDWQNKNNVPQQNDYSTTLRIQGPYERLGSAFDRELRKINTQYYATVDADFEILNPDFIAVMLKKMDDNPNLAVCATNKSPTGPYYDSILVERCHTWFCIYRRETLECSVSHFPYNEKVTGTRTWDTSAFFQNALRNVYNYELDVLDGKYQPCFIHYGAFTKNKHLDGTNIELYRLLEILIKIGHKNILDGRSYERYRLYLSSELEKLNIEYHCNKSVSNLAKRLYNKHFLEVDKSNPYKKLKTVS